MIKNILIVAAVSFFLWHVFAPKPHAHWPGELVSSEPIQTAGELPLPWTKQGYTFTPRAQYHIRGVVLSKHHYWAGEEEDKIAPYDLALGWGPMSVASVINALNITQYGRWYNYEWKGNPPLDLNEIILHSSNNHIIAADANVLDQIASIKRFDIVDIDGYLVDVSENNGWSWHTSLRRDDTAGGSCEVIWVKTVDRISQL